jgi:hypothetical protein
MYSMGGGGGGWYCWVGETRGKLAMVAQVRSHIEGKMTCLSKRTFEVCHFV